MSNFDMSHKRSEILRMRIGRPSGNDGFFIRLSQTTASPIGFFEGTSGRLLPRSTGKLGLFVAASSQTVSRSLTISAHRSASASASLSAWRMTAILIFLRARTVPSGQRWQWPHLSPLAQPPAFQNHPHGLHCPEPWCREPGEGITAGTRPAVGGTAGGSRTVCSSDSVTGVGGGVGGKTWPLGLLGTL